MEESRVNGAAPLVKITPDAQLDFDLPVGGNKDSVCKLALANISNSPVVFKIKTTAPKEYCVRPNSGVVNVGESTEVQVILQGPLPRAARKKDKFLVQTAAMPAGGPTEDLAQLLKELPPDQVQEVKLRCQWNFGNEEESSTSDATTASVVAPATVPSGAAPVPAKKEEPSSSATEEAGPIPTPRRNKQPAPAATAPASASTASSTNASSSSATTNNNASSSSAAGAGASGITKRSAPSAVAKPASNLSAATVPGAATAAAEANTLPSMALLIVAFILGIILGKFVL